jgi:predicted patatin/cPLA2 family phospholipase
VEIRDHVCGLERLYISVTEYESGVTRIVRAERENVFHLTRASVAIPVLYKEPVYLHDGMRYVDGAMGHDALPISQLLARYKPDSLVLFANCSSEYEKDSLITAGITKGASALLGLPQALTRSILNRGVRFQEEIHVLRQSGIPYLIIWSDDTVSALCRDKVILSRAVENARTHMHEVLQKAGL